MLSWQDWQPTAKFLIYLKWTVKTTAIQIYQKRTKSLNLICHFVKMGISNCPMAEKIGITRIHIEEDAGKIGTSTRQYLCRL